METIYTQNMDWLIKPNTELSGEKCESQIAFMVIGKKDLHFGRFVLTHWNLYIWCKYVRN